MPVFGISDEGYPDYEYEIVSDSISIPQPRFSELIEDRDRQVKNMIEIGVLADNLGYDYIVHPEHHFQIAGNTTPNPLLLQTYLASRTTDIRLLQMANILPWHDPIRLAEQINILDVISEGRAEVGIAHGSNEVEANVLGAQWGASADDRILNDVSFREKFRILKNQWTDANGSTQNDRCNGRTYEFSSELGDTSETPSLAAEHDQVNALNRSERNHFQIANSPVQEPHPQLWTPTMKEHSLKWAASRKINGCVHLIDFEKLAEQVSIYHQVASNIVADEGHVNGAEDLKRGWDKTRRRGIIPIVQVFDIETASEEAVERWTRSMAATLSDEENSIQPENVIDHLENRDNPLIGDSIDIERGLEEMWETAGYEDRAVFLQFKSGNMSHETHIRQVRSFMDVIAPSFE